MNKRYANAPMTIYPNDSKRSFENIRISMAQLFNRVQALEQNTESSEVDKITDDLYSLIKATANPTYESLIVTGLTGNRLVSTNSSKQLVSVTLLSNWINGTADQINVANDGDGSVTLSTPQDTATTSSLTFADLTLTGDLDITGDIQMNSGKYVGIPESTRIAWNGPGNQIEVYGELDLNSNNIVSGGSASFSELTVTGLTGVMVANGAGAVTASTGTENYLTKWGASNALADSLIRDDGTTVGINQAPNASYMMDVASGSTDIVARFISSDAGVGIMLEDGDPVWPSIGYVFVDASSMSLGGNASLHNDNLTITLVTGYVGIGNNGPLYHLDVNADTDDCVARFASSDDLAYIAVADDDTTGYFVVKDSRLQIGLRGSYNARNLTLKESGTNLFVGINSQTPTHALHVRSTGPNVARFEHDASGGQWCTIHLMHEDTVDTYGYLGLNENGYMYLGGINLLATEGIAVNITTGALGIGTFTPSGLFELYDTDANTVLTITSAHDTDYDPQIQFRTDGTPAVQCSVGVDAFDDSYNVNMGSGVGGAITGMTIDSSGDTTFSGSVTSSSFNATGLTASRLLATDASQNMVSSDLNSWVTGTANEITVGDDGDGTITLSLPDAITLVNLTVTDITIGANTLDTNEWAFLDGLDQALKQADSATFAGASLGTGELTCGSINRAAGTLTLEIGGTAELSLTSTTATFGGNIVIPDAGYIGSASDTDAIQISSAGNVGVNVAAAANYKFYIDYNPTVAAEAGHSALQLGFGITNSNVANYYGRAFEVGMAYAGTQGSTGTKGITAFNCNPINNNTGTTTWFGGFRLDVRNSSTGTVTRLYGGYVETMTNDGGGTVSNTYGYRVDAQTVGGNNFAFYCANGAGEYNFFADGAGTNLFKGPLYMYTDAAASIKFGRGYDCGIGFNATDMIIDYDLLNAGTTDLRIQENGTDRLVVLAGGGVGINCDPGSVLDIEDPSGGAGVRIIGHDNADHSFVRFMGGATVFGHVGYDNTNNVMKLNCGTALTTVDHLNIDSTGGIFMPSLKSGANQAAAGAAADELWHDTDDNTIKMGV